MKKHEIKENSRRWAKGETIMIDMHWRGDHYGNIRYPKDEHITESIRKFGSIRGSLI